MYVPVPNKEFPGWVEIPGYSQYLANKKGHLLNKKTKYSTKGGNAGRYLKVSVYKDGDDIATLQHVHDLICRAYWGAPVGAVVVKHKNDKRWDNRPSNLEWGTQSDNIKETYTRGIRKPTYGKRVSNENHKLKKAFYHLSFRDDLAGLWKPQLPSGSELPSGKYPEPRIPRISLATTSHGCFRAIYPNISHLFEVKKYPYVLMYVYRPVSFEDKDVTTQVTLTKNRFVWDAHVTGEVWLTKPTRMEVCGKIKIMNPDKSPTMYTHPFGDVKLPKLSVGPKDFEIFIEEDSGLESHDNDVAYTLGNLIVEEQDFKTLLSECPITYLPSGLLSRLPNAFQSGNLHESFDEEKPVVLYRNGDNQLSLVDGYQRLGQHLKVGTNDIPTQVIDLPMLDRFGFNDIVKEKPIWTDW